MEGFFWEDICERSNALLVCALVFSSCHPFFVYGLLKNFPLEHVSSCGLNLSSATVDLIALCGNWKSSDSSGSVDNTLGTAACFLSFTLAME